MKIIEPSDFEKLSPVFRGEPGHRFAGYLMHMLAFDKVNELYDHSGQYTGAEFTSGILKELGIDYMIGNSEHLKQLPDGAFITISNHPYGGLDGIIMIDVMAALRDDYKFMVNKILSLVRALKENFISVSPLNNENHNVNKISILGIREVITRLQEGHPVGFFPSGAISDFSFKGFHIRDREWQNSILNLIQSIKVPIIPVRFFDNNSLLFYFLGLIHWKIRLLRLPGELFNKRRKEIRIGIGDTISVEQQEQLRQEGKLSQYLRDAVYEMPFPVDFIPKSKLMSEFIE